WLMGYYPGYQTGDLPVTDVRFDLMTHVAVGAVLPNPDGSLDTTFYKDAVAGPAFAQDLASRTRQAGKKAILMVGGAGAHDGFVAAASDANRATFVTNLVGFAQQNGFDGIDLDWEPLPDSELDSFAALASALRAAWPDAVLTLPLNPINPNLDLPLDPRLGAISQSLDQLNVMSYSMAGAYDGWKSWHHSPLAGQTPATPTSISTSVDAYLAAGIPAARLGIGEGFYGLCYTAPVTGPLQDLGGATSSGDDNQLSYRSILSTYLPAATKTWDAAASSPYLTFAQPTGPLGCTYLSYTDEQAIAAHTDYVKQKGLGGAIVWTINEGHVPTAPANERDPLLAALWNGLK
ncbi:MAG: glycoside hydrolase family 18 protein, partial [Myxococcales bacterium]